MEQNLQLFHARLEAAKALIQSLVAQMNEGIAPDEAFCARLGQSLLQLRQVYQAIRLLAGDHVDGKPVSEYVSEWEFMRESEAERVRRGVLEQFLFVRCKGEKGDYQHCLNEQQTRARAALKGPVDEAIAAPYRLFIKLVTGESMSVQDMEALEQTDWSAVFIAGLYMNRYELMKDENLSSDAAFPSESESVGQVVAPDGETEPAAQGVVPTDQVAESAEELAPDMQSEEPLEDPNAGVSGGTGDESVASEFISADSNAISEPVSPVPLVTTLNADKLNEHKYNAKDAVKKLQTLRHHDQLALKALFVISHLGAVDAEALGFILQNSFYGSQSGIEDAIPGSLKLLTSDGYLAAYRFPGDQRTVYTLSDYSSEVFGKSTVKDWLRKNVPGNPSNKLRGFGRDVSADRLLATLRLADRLIAYIRWLYDDVCIEYYSSVVDEMRWQDGQLRVPVFCEGQRFWCTLVEDDSVSVTGRIVSPFYVGDAAPTATPGDAGSAFWLSLGEETALHIEKDGNWVRVSPTPKKTEVVPAAVGEAQPESVSSDDGEKELGSDATNMPQKTADLKTLTDFEENGSDSHSNENGGESDTMSENFPVETVDSQQQTPEPESRNWTDDVLTSSERMPAKLSRRLLDASVSQQAQELIKSTGLRKPPSDSQFLDLIQTLLAQETNTDFIGYESKVIQALVLAAACANDPEADRFFPETTWLYRRLCPALHLPMDDEPYSLELLDRYPQSEDEAVQALHLAAAIHARLFNSSVSPEYYTGKSILDNLDTNYGTYFSYWEELRPLYHALKEIRNDFQKGFTDEILVAAMDETARSEKERQLISKAKQFCSVIPKTAIRFTGLNAFMSRQFGKGSDMAECLSYVNGAKPSKDQLELVKEYLRGFCGDHVDDGLYEVNSDLLISYIQKGVQGIRGDTVPVKFTALSKICKEFKSRFTVLIEWMNLYESSAVNSEELRTAYNKTLHELKEAKSALLQREMSAWRNVLVCSINDALARLEGKSSRNCFAELLHTGLVPLDDQGLPVLEPELYGIAYSQPWYLMLEHIRMDVPSLEAARQAIVSGNGTDNCVQLFQIEELLKLPPTSYDERMLKSMEKRSDEVEQSVRNKLEEAVVFGRMDDNERERLMNYIVAMKPIYLEERKSGIVDFPCKDHGRWRYFLRAVKKNIEQNEWIQRERMASLLSRCKEQQEQDSVDKVTHESSDELLAEIQRMVDTNNYAVAEEYVNLFLQHYRRVPDSYRATEELQMDFDVFIRADTYEELLRFCRDNKSRRIRVLGNDWITRRALQFAGKIGRVWTSRNVDSGRRLFDCWPNELGHVTVDNIRQLLNNLGIEISSVCKVNSSISNADVFSVQPLALPRNKESYEHPIKFFGTAPDSTANVVCLYGNRTAASLLSDVSKCVTVNTTTYVFLDFPLDLTVRRQLAEQVRGQQIGAHSPMIVIDRVLALYLSVLEKNERLRALLSCSLPFAICQPFNEDRGLTADEMFAGRIPELNSIRRHNGACIVYGGRQLGKTALLHRAESLEHDPEHKRYAVYVDLLNCTDELETVQRIAEEISGRVDGFHLEKEGAEADMESLCAQLRGMIGRGEIVSFLLLLDETDRLLAAEAKRKFHATWSLYRLWKNNSNGRFKFVMAGLHDVRRTYTETNNQFDSPFGQMGQPLSVNPLSTADSQLLLMRPLRYLGFRMGNESVLKTILSYTCYFPGIIQFFGHQLVESVNSNYRQYYSAGKNNPPLLLAHEQLGAVMNSSELIEAIRHKINLTLDLDPRYKLLACCIAWYYMADDLYSAEGCSAQDIYNVAEAYQMVSLTRLHEYQLLALLDEMRVMGILVNSDTEKRYRFRRSSFMSVVGMSETELEKTIRDQNMREACGV